MFSGIVEAVSTIFSVQPGPSVTRISVKKPSTFNDLKIGDSIAIDGACLTVEDFNDESIQFALGFETLKLLKWTENDLIDRKVNMERSLRYGDRVHGHFVTGHIEYLGKVTLSQAQGDSWLLDIEVDSKGLPHFWKKGSITINGVSLTINDVVENKISVCLIPETIKRTNLASLKMGDVVNVEADMMAKVLVWHLRHKGSNDTTI
jgi:riboflavin synthase